MKITNKDIEEKKKEICSAISELSKMTECVYGSVPVIDIDINYTYAYDFLCEKKFTAFDASKSKRYN